ncbi:MAG TPA: hypothetical protein VFA28_01655 [Bryobacteraceae bacterium]|jgi:hypothetical protein|nr:hypothetical protein [Bryobacteraceae bacterium]
MRAPAVFVLLASAALAAEKYTGPRPPQPDIPYLLHASKLIPTEVVEAREEQKKNESTYIIPGASSPARTPLAEPIFLIEADKINPERLELYRLEVKGGQREITVSQKRRGGPRPLKLSVTRIDGRLFRVEAGEMLENGQYSLSPSDSNTAFCFEVY